MTSYSDSKTLKQPVSENKALWFVLLLLSIGAITTFCYQNPAALTTVSPHMYPSAPVSSGSIHSRILTLYHADTGKPRTVISLDDTGVR